MVTLTPEERKAVQRVRDSPIVEDIERHYNHLIIKFKTGIKETWLLRKGISKRFIYVFPRSRHFTEHQIPKYLEYNRNIIDHDYKEVLPYFLIQYVDFKKAGFCEVRIRIHELITELMEEGWINPQYTREALDNEKRKLLECDRTTISRKNGWMNPHRKGVRIGHLILSHFYDWGEYSQGYRISMKEAWENPLTHYYSINKLIKSKKDITRSNLIQAMETHPGRKICGPLMTSVAFYKDIISRILKLKKPKILDLSPMWGSKLLATWVLNGSYYHNNDFEPFVKASNGLSEYLNIPIYTADKSTKVDLTIISDLNCTDPKHIIQCISKYRHNSRFIIGFVSYYNVGIFRSMNNNIKLIKLKRARANYDHDYIVLYYQI